MALITQRDFETKVGQEKIIRTIHSLESKVHKLENDIVALAREDRFLERDIEGPESY